MANPGFIAVAADAKVRIPSIPLHATNRDENI
jgi:hypothetical protein